MPSVPPPGTPRPTVGSAFHVSCATATVIRSHAKGQVRGTSRYLAFRFPRPKWAAVPLKRAISQWERAHADRSVVVTALLALDAPVDGVGDGLLCGARLVLAGHGGLGRVAAHASHEIA
jgi:hypothetical protein